MKLVALVAVPKAVVTVIGPVVAPVGTVAVICVPELTVNDAAGLPLNLTLNGPGPKFVPVITTLVPNPPVPGAKLVMVGWPSSLLIVPTACASRKRALVGLCRSRKNVSSFSLVASPLMVTFTVAVVLPAGT